MSDYDYISRQAAIQNIDKAIPEWSEDKEIAIDCLKNTPSEEVPVKCIAKVVFDEEKLKEIVRNLFVPCEDCEFRSGDYCHEKSMYGRFIHKDDYCSRAIRRAEE